MAGGVLFVLIVTDVILIASRLTDTAPAIATSPAEMDDGAMGIFVLPILLGIVAGLPTVAIVSGAVVLGLPIRLIPAARVWVVRHRWLPVTCAVLGVVCFVGAEVFRPRISPPSAFFFEPSSLSISIALLLTAVGLTNFWQPRKRRWLPSGNPGSAGPGTQERLGAHGAGPYRGDDQASE
jgi:hypothetical protein